MKSKTQREKIESSKKKVTHYIQGNVNATNGWLLIQNNGVQKAVEWYTQNVERKKKLSFKSLIYNESPFQKWRWNKDIPRYTKTGEFVASRPVLLEILKELQVEMK